MKKSINQDNKEKFLVQPRWNIILLFEIYKEQQNYTVLFFVNDYLFVHKNTKNNSTRIYMTALK